MSILDETINVTISRGTLSVTRVGFKTVLILAVNKGFTDLTKRYANLSAVLEDFPTVSAEYMAARDVFAQAPTVNQIIIARRATSDTAVVTVATVQDNTTYTCTLNGTVFSINSGVGATAISIAGLLVAAINAGSVPVTALDNADGTYDLTADVAGVAFSMYTCARQTQSFTTTQTPAEDLADIQQEDDDWYGIVSTSRVQAVVENIAAYTETQTKIFIAGTADANVVDTTAASDLTTVSAVFKAASYLRSAVFYLISAVTQYAEAALLGKLLPLDVGSWTAKFKTLSGITVDNLTTTQQTNALAKNTNIYLPVGGRSVVYDGKMAEGEYLDIVVLIDWIQSRIKENVFALLASQPKVSFTDAGITSIGAEIEAVLQEGIALGGISSEIPYVISLPKVADISAVDKANRTLNNIKFTCTLTGAIHYLNIAGTVVL